MCHTTRKRKGLTFLPFQTLENQASVDFRDVVLHPTPYTQNLPKPNTQNLPKPNYSKGNIIMFVSLYFII